MGFIEDGKGRGLRAEVNEEQELVVKAVTISEFEQESQDNGNAYNWSSGIIDVDAGADTVLLVKNTSDNPLFIESISIANGALASAYTVHLPTIEVTPAGTTVTGTNLNTASSNVAEATSKSKETNNTQGNIIFTRFMAVDRDEKIETRGLILAKNKSVGVDVTEDTAESAVTIRGHYGK